MSAPRPPHDHVVEFDCAECGRHIIDVSGQPPQFHLCATCLHVPGWQKIPELVAVIDPEWEKREAGL